jgi:very-short-patch-repair endonuclease
MLLTKHVAVKMGGANIKHYQKLGYAVKSIGDEILVPIEHLTLGSHCDVEIMCDYCQRVFLKEYKCLTDERKNSYTKKDCCIDCTPQKRIETHLFLYGVENTLQRPEIKEKIKNTNIERYGSEFVSQNEEIKKKARESNNSRTKEEKKKSREKTSQTCLERYGVSSPLKMSKTRKRLFEVRSSESSQQTKIYEILKKKYGKKNVSKNVPLEGLSLDVLVCLSGILIDVEYDSWYWHSPCRDRRRDEFLKSIGYKILRIKSGKKIPDETLLFEKLEKLIKSENTYSKIILEDWNEEEYQNKEREAK